MRDSKGRFVKGSNNHTEKAYVAKVEKAIKVFEDIDKARSSDKISDDTKDIWNFEDFQNNNNNNENMIKKDKDDDFLNQVIDQSILNGKIDEFMEIFLSEGLDKLLGNKSYLIKTGYKFKDFKVWLKDILNEIFGSE